MTPQDVERMYQKLTKINRLDSTLDRLAKSAEASLDELGEKVIGVVGRNVLDKRKDWVGRVVFCALFNTLLQQREAMRQELSGLVDIPESHHKTQTKGEDDED